MVLIYQIFCSTLNRRIIYAMPLRCEHSAYNPSQFYPINLAFKCLRRIPNTKAEIKYTSAPKPIKPTNRIARYDAVH